MDSVSNLCDMKLLKGVLYLTNTYNKSYYVPDTVLSTLQLLTHLILPTKLTDKFCYSDDLNIKKPRWSVI